MTPTQELSWFLFHFTNSKYSFNKYSPAHTDRSQPAARPALSSMSRFPSSSRQTAGRLADASANWRVPTSTDRGDQRTLRASSSTSTPRGTPPVSRPGSSSGRRAFPEEETAKETEAALAIAEGRRLYVGNLPYMAKTRDIEQLFASENFIMCETPLPLSHVRYLIPCQPAH